MDPKFIKLEDAAQLLKISTERLNELREDNQLRAYRDGASWKFRTDEIEKMVEEGIPSPPSDISGLSLEEDDLSLGKAMSLDDSDDGGLDLVPGSSAELSIDLDAELESIPDVQSDLDLDDIEADDGPESILLSEEELGESVTKPPSTIIGQAESDAASDLDLVGDSTLLGGEILPVESGFSDVMLADVADPELGTSDTGEMPAAPASSSTTFDDIEEMELDLEAESSRILSPDDVAAAQKARSEQQQAAPAETSDLKLEDELKLAPTSDVGLSGLSQLGSDSPSEVSVSDIHLGGESAGSSDPGLTGLSALELDDDDDDDDFVLGDGSDLTLSSADSGINLSPADSGLALDDAALELTGAAVASGLDFGEAVGEASGLLVDAPADEEFELTPTATDEGEDSSQVIALDAFEEEQEADELLGSEDVSGAVALATPAAAGFAATTMMPQVEAQFSGWLVSFLVLCTLLLSLCGMMIIDVVRSMWSWNEPYQVNSSIIEAISGLFF